MDFKNLNLSEFIRYILTGFNFILFVVALPTLYIQPALLKDFVNEASVLIVFLLSIAVGYLLDILKVYQMTPRFIFNQNKFMDKIAETLNIPREQASSYFSLTSKLWNKYGIYDLERRNSEWVLSTHTAFTLIISTLVWSGIVIFYWFQSQNFYILVFPACGTALSLMLALRLFRIANQGREKSDQIYLIILEKNKAAILDSWKLTIQDEKGVDEV